MSEYKFPKKGGKTIDPNISKAKLDYIVMNKKLMNTALKCEAYLCVTEYIYI